MQWHKLYAMPDNPCFLYILTTQVALATPVTSSIVPLSHHDAQLVAQLQSQLQAAAGLGAQAEAVAAANADLAQQVGICGVQ